MVKAWVTPEQMGRYLGRLAPKGSTVHFVRNVPQALTRMLLDLIDHFVKFVLFASFLIVLFIFQSEVVLPKPLALTNAFQIDITCQTVIQLLKS
jgi:hypothetical protein